MITKLHIKNIGIIEDVEIDFNNGLNVLTGETGAGKSLIIKSLRYFGLKNPTKCLLDFSNILNILL